MGGAGAGIQGLWWVSVAWGLLLHLSLERERGRGRGWEGMVHAFVGGRFAFSWTKLFRERSVLACAGDSKKAELASCEQEMARLERQQALAAAAAAAGQEGGAGQVPGLTPQASRRAVGGGQQPPPSAEPSSASALSTMSAGSAAIAAAGLQVRPRGRDWTP